MVRDIFIISFICFNLFRYFRILDIIYHLYIFYLFGLVVPPALSLNPVDDVPFTLHNELVSLFVVDHLGLEAREQSKLIAAKGFSGQCETSCSCH